MPNSAISGTIPLIERKNLYESNNHVADKKVSAGLAFGKESAEGEKGAAKKSQQYLPGSGGISGGVGNATL